MAKPHRKSAWSKECLRGSYNNYLYERLSNKGKKLVGLEIKQLAINVLGSDIHISLVNNSEYVSLTDMAANNGGNDKIQQWIRNKDTVEFLGVWEQLYNPDFNSV